MLIKLQDLITEEKLDKQQKNEILKDFIKFCGSKLSLTSYPKIKLSYQPNKASEIGSFGGYNPEDKSIIIYCDNRNLADCLRSLSHEMVHYYQDLKGTLKPNSGDTGSPEENEANAIAGVIMRQFKDQRRDFFE